MTESLFGPLFSQWDLEQAVCSTLRTWIPEYLAEVERQHGLRNKIIPRPPTPESIHGGVDFESWAQETAPEVIVVVKPDGEPERSPSGDTQAYQVQVGCRWAGVGSELAELPEDEARGVMSYYGAACKLVAQQPTLQGLVSHVVLEQDPDVTLPGPEVRAQAQVVTSFRMWAITVIEGAGPQTPSPSESPEYTGPEEPFAERPTVESINITVTAES